MSEIRTLARTRLARDTGQDINEVAWHHSEPFFRDYELTETEEEYGFLLSEYRKCLDIFDDSIRSWQQGTAWLPTDRPAAAESATEFQVVPGIGDPSRAVFESGEEQRARAVWRVIAAQAIDLPHSQEYRQLASSRLVPPEMHLPLRSRLIGELRRSFALSAADAESLVLALESPEDPLQEVFNRYRVPITIELEVIEGVHANAAKILVTAEPWVSETELVQAFRGARRQVLGGKGKTGVVEGRTRKLVEWVSLSRHYSPSKPLRSIAEHWNTWVVLGEDAGIPATWKYQNRDSLSRDYKRGREALLKPKYTLQGQELGVPKRYRLRTLREQVLAGQAIWQERKRQREEQGSR